MNRPVLRPICSRNGRTMAELVLYMALLLIVGLLVFSLAGSGSEAYVALTGKSTDDSAVRTAVSYIDKTLRKNDAEGRLTLRENPFGSGSALVCEIDYDGTLCEMWIYCAEGGLYELLILSGEQPDHLLSSHIADIDNLELGLSDSGLLRVKADKGGSSLSLYLYLRSEGV